MNEKSSFDLDGFARLLEAQIKAAEAQREREQLKPEMKAIEGHVDELCGVPKEWTDQWHQSNERVNHEVMAQLNIARQLLVRCQEFVPRTTILYRDINLFMEPKYRPMLLEVIREIPLPPLPPLDLAEYGQSLRTPMPNADEKPAAPDELHASAKRMMAQVRQDGEDRLQSEENADYVDRVHGRGTVMDRICLLAERRALRKLLTGSADGVL